MRHRCPNAKNPFLTPLWLLCAAAGIGCGNGNAGDASPTAGASAGAGVTSGGAGGGVAQGNPNGGAAGRVNGTSGASTIGSAGQSAGGAGGSSTGTAGATADGGAAQGGGGASTAGANTGGVSTGGASTGGSSASSGGSAGMSAAGATGSSSPGCGLSTVPPSADVQQTLQVNGTTRYYLLYVPPGATPDKPLPLVFVFHGRGESNVWAAAPPDSKDWYGRFALKEASAKQAILVYPMGSTVNPGSPGTSIQLPASLGQSSWNADPDLAFFDALWTELKTKYCIDTPHVFAAGYSMGAAFSNTLGCQRASVIRAVAPIEGWGPGSPPTSGTPSCTTEKGQESAFVIHGTKDATIPYSIGQESAAFWRADAGCSANTSQASSYSTAKLSCVAYQGCAPAHDTFFCTHGGDHQIPADAGTEIWKFFSAIP